MLQMSSKIFYSLVRSVACRLIENFELASTKPHTHAAPQSARLAGTVVDGIPGLKHKIHESEFNTQAEDIQLLRAYIQIVNSKTFPDHNLGEDYTKLLVYAAIHRHQTLVVKRIKEAHRQYGKHFGSERNYSKEDLFEHVVEWYEKFNLSNFLESALPHPVLPKDEPGYLNWVEADRKLSEDDECFFCILYRGIGADNPIPLRIYDYADREEKVLIEEGRHNSREILERIIQLQNSDPYGFMRFYVEKA